MANMFEVENFDVGTATIIVKKKENPESFTLYLKSCNSIFSSLSGLQTDHNKDIAEYAFGDNVSKYLFGFFNLQEKDPVYTVVLYFQKTGKWLLTKSNKNSTGTIDLICFDFT